MTIPGHRHERVGEEMRHELSVMVSGELKDPRIATLVTVTEVRVTPDLKLARVFVSVLGSAAEQASTMKGLAAAAGYMRHEVCQRLALRRGPEILFVLDRSEEYSQRIEELIRETKKQERE